LISFSLIDKRLKIIQGHTPEVGNSEEYFLSVFLEFFLISMKIDLALEYKSPKFIGAAPTE